MSVYLVTQVKVLDPEKYKNYSQHGSSAAEQYGGRFLVEGGAPELIEGKWEYPRMAIVEFPDRESALAFYNSPEYQSAKEIRQTLADFNMVLVDPKSGIQR
jgi:uncharacterized protein (DUF1330 family)